jgi:hypothetical protein
VIVPPTIADGQVAAAAAAIVSGVSGPVSLTFTNVGGLSETLVLTVVRGSTGTARRIRRDVLAANEQLILAGLPLNVTDVLKAATSNASSVDYVAVAAPDGAPLRVAAYDANGALKQVNTGISGNQTASGALTSNGPTSGVGYSAGAGGAVTQLTSRTTGVTLNTVTGAITLVSAAGSATPASFTVTNSAVAATDIIVVSQKSGTDKYEIFVTAVAAGSFVITSFTTGGTTTEQPVFSFAVVKGVAA